MNDTAQRPRLGVLLGATSEREADEFEELAARTLALLVEPIDPPATLRDAVLSSVLAEPWAGSARADVPGAAPAAAPAHALAAAPGSDSAGVSGAPRHRTAADPVGLRGRRRFRGDGPTVLAALDHTPDARHVSTEFLAGAASITVVASADAKAAVAVVSGLPQPPDGRTYQLWTIRKGRPRGAGTFLPDARSHAEVRLAGRYRRDDVVAITVEPLGGSRRPTTEPLFALAA